MIHGHCHVDYALCGAVVGLEMEEDLVGLRMEDLVGELILVDEITGTQEGGELLHLPVEQSH